MTSEPPRVNYQVREMPFDEWADVDTLVHRTSATSGDFDYVLRPLCADCGSLLALEYADLEEAEGVSQLAALVCDDCRIEWQLTAEA
ncbi:MAG TPA: hypothetical protein QGF05_04940 [Dehalococcoidia bacterium]|nr:hypothetical protein [Dehalococcoidia bacterium]